MIYFIQQGEDGPIKIGYTGRSIVSRLGMLQTGSAQKLYLLGVMDGEPEKEQEIQNHFKIYHARGEWFFPREPLLAFIKENTSQYQVPKAIDTPGISGLVTIEALQAQVMTISEIAEGLGIPYSTLAEAARLGKIKARRSGNAWLSTIADVRQAILAGKLRGPKQK